MNSCSIKLVWLSKRGIIILQSIFKYTYQVIKYTYQAIYPRGSKGGGVFFTGHMCTLQCTKCPSIPKGFLLDFLHKYILSSHMQLIYGLQFLGYSFVLGHVFSFVQLHKNLQEQIDTEQRSAALSTLVQLVLDSQVAAVSRRSQSHSDEVKPAPKSVEVTLKSQS